jgi:oligoendopeptidase F
MQNTWNLGLLYQSHTDPKLHADQSAAKLRAETFASVYKGKVSSLNPEQAHTMLEELFSIGILANRPVWYSRLAFDLDTANMQSKALLDELKTTQAKIINTYNFAYLELSNLPDAVYTVWSQAEVLREYWYHLEYSRQYQPYQRSDLEEQILRQKNLTGVQAWVQLYGEISSNIKIRFVLDS